MRLDVKKFLFIGIEAQRSAFFSQAQDAGIIHFIESKGQGKEIPAEVNNVIQSIKVLRSLPTAPQEDPNEASLADGIVLKVLHFKHHLEKLAEEERLLRLEMERIAIFGNFLQEDLAYIEQEGKRKIQFFFKRHTIAEEIPLPDEMIYIGTNHNLDYFVTINREPTQYPRFTEMRIERPLGALQQRYQVNKQELQTTEQQLKTYAKYNTFLHHHLAFKFNNYHLCIAQESVQLQAEDNLFVIEGWVPVNKLDHLANLVETLDVHVEEIAIEATDSVPTYLENKGINRVAEDLVHIYDTPSATDKDPSLWVLAAFSLFFAFIVGDGGYGLIFLLVALYIRYKSPSLIGFKKRIWTLLLILSLSCIGWGFLTNSFFGINFHPDNPIRKASVLSWLVEKKTDFHINRHDETYQHWVEKFPELKNEHNALTFMKKASTETHGNISYDLVNKFSDNIMMELALLIGCIHVIISMLRYLNRTWTFIGWIVFIIGCYLYFPFYLDATSILHFVFNIDTLQAASIGLYLIGAGAATALLISLVQYKIRGLLEIMKPIEIFADILSYLRLYALGLAGAIVTGVINDTVAVVNIFAGTLLFIIAHSINMLLAVMGGVIHGLRLNFLEWYHYSFEGGGKRFKPLNKMNLNE